MPRRVTKGQPGAYEMSLVGTPLAKPEWPLEILRTIHSFDPCMACAIHMVDADGKDLGEVATGLNVCFSIARNFGEAEGIRRLSNSASCYQ